MRRGIGAMICANNPRHLFHPTRFEKSIAVELRILLSAVIRDAPRDYYQGIVDAQLRELIVGRTRRICALLILDNFSNRSVIFRV